MMRNKLAILLSAILISGCEACVSKFYQVHEKQTHINISFPAKKEVINKLEKYIDSSKASHKQDSEKCPNALIELKNNDRIVCLYKPNCICYFITISTNYVIVRGVFIPVINDRSWLLFQEHIPDAELDSVQVRFKREILDKL